MNDLEFLSSGLHALLSRLDYQLNVKTTYLYILSRISVGKVRSREEFASSLLMALFGGIVLIVPTVIMAKYPAKNSSLVTTAVPAILFTTILVFGAKDSIGKDVSAAIAAYAAVLVVFIGTSFSSPSSSNTCTNA